MNITVDEVMKYLRVSSYDEYELIRSLTEAAKKIVSDVSRALNTEETDSPVFRIAVLYTVAYLYEHREEADHGKLNLTLRALLFGERREEF